MKAIKLACILCLVFFISGCAASQNATNTKTAISLANSSTGKIFVLFPDLRFKPLQFIPDTHIEIYHNNKPAGILNLGDSMIINANSGKNMVGFKGAISFSGNPDNINVFSNKKDNIYVIVDFQLLTPPTAFSGGTSKRFLTPVTKAKWLELAKN